MRLPPPHRRRVLPALALAALALGGAAGCGGDTESQPRAAKDPARTAGDDEAQIRATVEQSYKTRDPRACARITTQRFLEQVTFEQGPEARRVCERSTRTALPSRSVAITQVEVRGSRASVRAVPEGGDAAGQDVRLALVERGDAWRLDRMTALRIDRVPFDAALRRILVREPDAMSAEQADCVVRRLGRISDTRLARALVDSDRALVTGATIACAREVFEATIRQELLNGQRKVTAAQAECVIRGLRERLTDEDLQRVLESGDPQSAPPRALTDALGALLAECTSNATIT